MELSRLASRMPATAASVEHMMKQVSLTRRTLMPARRAASALPPTAYTCRPKAVRPSRKLSPTSRTSSSATTSGTPLIEATAGFRLRSMLR